jgi:hypothetical protein
MGKVNRYGQVLSALPLQEWEPFLVAESGLPGPRGNLELVQAVAALGNRAMFEQLLAWGPDEAPTNTPGEFLAVCGVVGMGRLLAQGKTDVLAEIRRAANDPRWRVREGAAMALQRLGHANIRCLMGCVGDWRHGTLLEQRALAAGICEPALLHDHAVAEWTLQLLDETTAGIAEIQNRRCDDFKTLRKGLAYCWSVAVVALPEVGKPLMEKWMLGDDRDVVWVMKQNLRKNRLVRMDLEWVSLWRTRLGIVPRCS